jgi:phosphohistidine phosphatase SixA
MLKSLGLAALATMLAGVSSAQSPTVVIIVRHAEKAATPADDPPLTEAGTTRAKALAATLANAHVDGVITTQLRRTKDTAEPTIRALGIARTQVVPTSSDATTHAAAVAAAVRSGFAGKTVLVVGHSNTVMRIIDALGGPKLPDLCDSQYSGLYTLVLDGTSARLVEGTFGAPSPDVATGCPKMKS